MNLEYPSIILLSKLPNRLRLKLTIPLKSSENILNKLKEHEGIIKCTYNPSIQSLLVNFNNKIEVEELLIKLSILYSEENNFKPIKIISSLPKREIPISAFYSLGFIALAGAAKIFIQSKSVQDLFNWLAAGTTIFSIVEHAKNELDTKGAVDPEVISVIYLINSIKNGTFVNASAVTWLTTYGRHFIDLNFADVLLKINKVVDSSNNESLYEVSLLDENNSNKNMTFVKTLVTKYIERQSPTGRNNLLFTNSSLSLVNDRHFEGFKNQCDKIIFRGKGHKFHCA